MLRPCATALVFFVLALGVHAPALHGPFVSDDYLYLGGNPYVQQPGASNFAAMLDPRSEATSSVQNYAPLTLLLHSAAWRAFGDAPLGHHVLNVAIHSVACALLVELFLALGVALAAALAGGLLFLLHPANVEAVAWVSQLKSTASLALAVAALLARQQRPALGLALFALALVTKASALFALPVALTHAWVARQREPAALAAGRPWPWLGGWALAALVLAALQIPANQQTNAEAPLLHADPWVRARSIVAIAGRYAALALTGHGASTFHEPPPALRWGDPWFLLGAAAIALVAARGVATLRRDRMEAVGWVWVAAAFAPVSQIVPFLYPMADRYLYPILPGLLAAGLLALRPALARRAGAGLGAAALALGLAAVYAAESHARAKVWATAGGPVDDAIAHYPDGTSARLRRAQLLAQRGDRDGAVATLRSVKPFALEMNALLADPVLRGLRGHPGFDALLRDVAARWIDWGRRLPRPGPRELRQIAIAHMLRGELPEARSALERALALGGPRAPEIRADLEQLARLEAALRTKGGAPLRSTPPGGGGTPAPGGP